MADTISTEAAPPSPWDPFVEPLERYLSILCPRLKFLNASETQRIYLLLPAEDAARSFEILTMHGFEGRIYHADDPSKPSKLYLNWPPAMDISTAEKRFQEMHSYAAWIKKLLTQIDALCKDDTAAPGISYQISFPELVHQGRQVSIKLFPPQIESGAPIASPLPSQPLAATASPSQASLAPRKRKTEPDHEDQFAAGPAIGKSGMINMRKKGKKKQPLKQEGFLRRFYIYAGGNMTSVVVIILQVIVAAAIVISLLNVARNIMCPDFATAKSSAWYCKTPEQRASEKKLRGEHEAIFGPGSSNNTR